jgi:hypothetical protein
MTKEEALKAIEAHLAFMEKPMPAYGTEAFDDYSIEAHTLSVRLRRAMREHPTIRGEGDEPTVTSPAKKL